MRSNETHSNRKENKSFSDSPDLLISLFKFLAPLLAGCTFIVGDPHPGDQPSQDLAVCTAAQLAGDPRNCGVCGHDCTRLPGVDPTRVTCVLGACNLVAACLPGRADCTTADGCETDATTAAHCGSCTRSCAGALPLCTRDAFGALGCASTCGTVTPTPCGTTCVDTTSDPNHCGSCTRVCTAGTNMVATCTNGLCGGECQFGFHACGTGCADDTSPQSCGTSCTPCPKPTNGFATCDAIFGCDFDCNPGFVKTSTGCIVGMSMDLRSTDLRSSSTDLRSTDLATSSSTDMTVDNRPLCDCSGIPACALGMCVGTNCCQECTIGFPLCGNACTADPTCQPSTH